MMSIAAMFLAALCLAATPATQPTSRVHEWLIALASDDSAAREHARRQMLGMTRKQLHELRQLVAEGKASLPSQTEPLYDIVRHVFLATEPYPPAPGAQSFFGLYAHRLVDEGGYTGVVFQRRLPGFDAYRALEAGDMIIGVEEMPQLVFEGMEPLKPVRNQCSPGQTIHLRVLRDSRIITVPFTLAATPDRDNLEDMTVREKQAEGFWAREFQPLLTRSSS